VDGLLSGQFPVRINAAAGNGYGYLDPVMYPGLFLYIPAFLRIWGMSYLAAYKIFIFIINLATAALTYHCALKLCKTRMIALIASAAYTLALYRLADVFTRAALGEMLALMFFPCLILGTFGLFHGDAKDYKYFVIGVTGILNSHILSLEMAFILLFPYALLFARRVIARRERMFALGKAVGLIVLLNAWVLIPLLTSLQTGLSVTANVKTAASQTFLYNFFSGAMVSLPEDFNSFFFIRPENFIVSINAFGALGTAVYLFGRFVFKKNYPNPALGKRLDAVGDTCLVYALVCLFMTSHLFPWGLLRNIPLLGAFLNSVQFAWRYFGIASLLIAVVSAIGIYRFAGSSDKKAAFTAVSLAVILLSASPFIEGYIVHNAVFLPDKFSKLSVNAVDGLYYRDGFDYETLWTRPPRVEAFPQDGTLHIQNYERSYNDIILDFSADAPQTNAWLEAPLYYYAGYRATLNNETNLPVGESDGGFLRVFLPDGQAGGQIHIFYREPAAWRLAEWVALLTVPALIAAGLGKRFIIYKKGV
jgi:hypothetical protein